MTCPCDVRVFPPPPDIAAGLDRLPRQLATFGEFRLALLDAISDHPALADWRAREGDDFGVMILEWWAYVLDVLAFYSGEIAGESYLRTAARDESVRRIVGLIGYTPKPPMASTATLALFADSGQPALLRAGSGFRSDAFGDEPPQVFETSVDAIVDVTLNAWTLAPARQTTFGQGPLLLTTTGASARPGQIAVVETGAGLHAARVAATRTITALDGADYVQVTLDPPAAIALDQDLATIRLTTMALSAGLNPFAGASAISRTSMDVTLILDALYPQLRAGGTVVLSESESGRLHAARITSVGTSSQIVVPAADSSSDPARAPFTALVIDGAGPSWIANSDSGAFTLHFRPVPGGTVTRAADISVELSHLQGGAALDGPTEPLRQATAGTIALWDAQEAGALVSANVTDDGTGNATLTPLSDAAGFPKLRTPVRAFGNLVIVTRGETVEETLGVGDATQVFQRFLLQKAPLTYLPATGVANGRKSTLEVWVDGSRWTETPSFFTTGPADRVYTVRQTVDGKTEVTFGGLGTGQPLPSGATVTARYRYGGGAASPPAGAITQLARPVKGLRRALNPLAAFGGDDGDAPEAIRTAAPASALSLGRLVSLIDFEAAARSYGGVINATARMDWVEREQRAAVLVWIIPQDMDQASQVRDALEGHLRAVSAAGTPVAVAVAAPYPVTFSFDVEVAAERDPADAKTAAAEALRGFLSLETIPIGAPLFRADLLAEIRAVDGVETVRALFADGARMPIAIETVEGAYVDATVLETW